MKLLFENWQEYVNEEVVDFPSNATLQERYDSYRKHLSQALEQLYSMRTIFEQSGFDMSIIDGMITNLRVLGEDEDLKHDVETY